MMKTKILAVIGMGMIYGSAHAAPPSFAGVYRAKQCSVTAVNNKVTPPDLAIEILKSDAFVISQTGDRITIDGNTTYWNMAPNVYLTSVQDGYDTIRIRDRSASSTALAVEYTSQSGDGLNKSTDYYDITLGKRNDGSVRFEMTSMYRNVLTLGIWKKSAKIVCDFIP